MKLNILINLGIASFHAASYKAIALYMHRINVNGYYIYFGILLHLKLEFLYILSPCTFVEMYENEKQENRLRQRAFKDFIKPN